MSDRGMSDYEIGYRDGESSGEADWYHALTEHTDISDNAKTPMEAVAEINRLIKAARHKGAKEMHERIGRMIAEAERRMRFDAALVVEGFAHRYDGTTEMKETILALPLSADNA